MKGITLLFIALALSTFNYAQKVDRMVDNISNQIIEWRRHIHENPELSFKETNTTEYVAGVLKSLDNIEIVLPTPPD